MVRLSGMKRRSSGAKSVTVTKMVTKPASKSSFVSSYIPKAIVPGYTRQSGFYGRYNTSPNPNKGEDKFFDTTLGFSFDTTGEVPSSGQLALIPQGVTESTRVGRKCTVKSIQIRGSLTMSPAASATACATAYLYLVLDTQCNGAPAAITDVLTSNAMNQGLINMANSGRFRILKRWAIPFNPAAGATTALNSVVKPIEYFKKCNIPIEYSSTTGAISEIRSNNIFLLAGCHGAGVFDDLVSMAGTARIKFSDQ